MSNVKLILPIFLWAAIIFFQAISLLLRAQSPSGGSVEADSVQVLLGQAGALMGLGDFDAAEATTQSAYRIALELPSDDPSRFIALRKLVRINFYNHNFEGAQNYAQRALAEAQALDSLALQAEMHYMKGFVSASSGKDEAALRSYETALRQGKAAKDTLRLIKTYINMAQIYGERFDYDMCIKMTRPVLHLAEAVGDSFHLSIALQNIGVGFQELENVDSAIYCFERSLQVNTHPRGAYKLVFPLVNLGTLYRDKGDTLSYERNIRRAFVIADTVPKNDIKAAAYRHMAEYFLMVGKYDSAQVQGGLAQYHSVFSGAPMQNISATGTLALIYSQLGKYELANCYYRQLRELESEKYLLEKEEYGKELEV